ncbi:HugZ family protein [Listeria grandensis]|uniref:HugZ family pyridoxamine 5'-phosphate oxidase n=1 Tax=Listeria grandensis TaxID=1494963 RepID=UPI00164DE388|nr:pyridoxamine 5'-phosphate oxidase family protein [Listeria grandensis]MBC6315753.1 heme iron utilization protein [Listeria grandensis]
MVATVKMDQVKSRYDDFLESRKTIVISSQDSDGHPFISYAPFVKHEGKLYIYISAIAEHYDFIEQNETIQIMMLADEANTKNLFARERLYLRCQAKNIGNDNLEPLFAKMEAIHGTSLIRLLRTIDMSIFELTPQAGRYVIGFGQAFTVDFASGELEHIVVNKK